MTQNTPSSNTNKYYATADTYDVSGLLTELSLKGSVDTEDVSAGSGTEHVQRAAKLRDTTGSFSAAYVEGKVPQYIYRIKPGNRITFVACPEGNVSGKPMHKQDFIVKSVDGPKQSVDKSKILFAAELEAADAPMVDLYAGGTVP